MEKEKMMPQDGEARRQNINEHLSNERTLLAWVRTGIGIMAFGFVVMKFSLFIRLLTAIMGSKAQLPEHGYSGPVGILVIAVGAMSLALSLLRYRATRRQIDTGSYRHSSFLLYAMVGLIIVVSLLLLAYLIRTI